MGRQLVWAGVVAAVLAGGAAAGEGARIRVYLRSGDGDIPLEAEGVTWRAGPYTTSGATMKVTMSARVGGPRSAFAVTLPAEFLIVFPRAAPQPALQLLRADQKKDRREFDVEFVWGRNYEGWSGKKKARVDIGPGEPEGEGVRVRIEALGQGEYGFLFSSPTGELVPADKVYTFSNSPAGASEAPAGGAGTALPDAPGVYIETAKGRVPVASEQFEWFPYSWSDNVRMMASVRSQWYERRVKTQRMNGMLPGLGELPALRAGDRIGIVVAEGAGIGDYRLVRIEHKDDGRQLRLDALFVNGEMYLGFGRASLSPGPEPILYEASKVAPRKYRIALPALKPGTYGLLAPGVAVLGKTGAVHCFEVR